MTNRMLGGCRRVGVRVAYGMGLGVLLWMFAMPGVAATEAAGLDWVRMIIQLAGGLALFLFGMDQMGESLKVVAGDKMRQILGKLTTNRLMGLVTGTVVTAIIQSFLGHHGDAGRVRDREPDVAVAGHRRHPRRRHRYHHHRADRRLSDQEVRAAARRGRIPDDRDGQEGRRSSVWHPRHGSRPDLLRNGRHERSDEAAQDLRALHRPHAERLQSAGGNSGLDRVHGPGPVILRDHGHRHRARVAGADLP